MKITPPTRIHCRASRRTPLLVQTFGLRDIARPNKGARSFASTAQDDMEGTPHLILPTTLTDSISGPSAGCFAIASAAQDYMEDRRFFGNWASQPQDNVSVPPGS